MKDVPIQGFCDARFRPLEDAFRANFDAGLELGASLAVMRQGRLVVDLWAGWANVKRTRPWRQDTIVLVYSTTKIAAILSLLMVIDRGLIELDEPVARYWPEFAANGKGSVTARDVLTHQAGVPGFQPPLPDTALGDWEAVTSNIAAQRHWFEGRRKLCYHPLTFGFLIGELIRRTDGRKPAQFFCEEVAQRIGADFQIGLSPDEDLSRVAQPYWAEALSKMSDPLMARVVDSMTGFPGRWENRHADSPASNGYANGRAIAQLCAIFAMRGVFAGTRLLSAQMVDEAAREQVAADDPGFGELHLGLGLGLNSFMYPYPSPSWFGWGGAGGSFGLMDQATGISCGYAPNRMHSDYENEPVDPRERCLWGALAKVSATL